MKLRATAFAFFGLLVALTAAVPASAQAPVTLRYGHYQPRGPAVEGEGWFAEEVTKRTGGKVKIEKLLLDPPDYVLSAKAFDMILAVPKYGRVKANKILTQCRISPSKTIGGLSERQRAELVQFLRR